MVTKYIYFSIISIIYYHFFHYICYVFHLNLLLQTVKIRFMAPFVAVKWKMFIRTQGLGRSCVCTEAVMVHLGSPLALLGCKEVKCRYLLLFQFSPDTTVWKYRFLLLHYAWPDNFFQADVAVGQSYVVNGVDFFLKTVVSTWNFHR